MCNSRKINIDRMKDLDHVKILAKSFSNIENISMGIYLDKDIYRFEPRNAREYICFTVKMGGVWQLS